MASITMTASFLGTATVLKQPSIPARRGVVMANAMKSSETNNATNEETNTNRRDLMFAVAAAAAAACSLAKVAIAEEPKRGTAEAKKKYAPVCVTMPSARICYK